LLGPELLPDEKGFADDERICGFVPKRDSPRLVVGFKGIVFSLSLASLSFFSLVTTSVIRTPRSTRTLPSFRLHVFRRHVKMYSRLSWP